MRTVNVAELGVPGTLLLLLIRLRFTVPLSAAVVEMGTLIIWLVTVFVNVSVPAEAV